MFPASSRTRTLAFLLAIFLAVTAAAHAASHQTIFIDTDIGDDIDDAFAISLALQSPNVEVIGITTAWGDTHLRARLVSRLLAETNHAAIPLGQGITTPTNSHLSQQAFAEAAPDATFPDGVDLLRRTILAHPGKITLVAIGPLTNVAALIDRDPAAFHKLKRVVIMGGSVYSGYGSTRPTGPTAEYNIRTDIAAAQKLFTSGIPLTVLPLDSTILPLDVHTANAIYTQDPLFGPILRELKTEWSPTRTPTLYDVMAVATVVDPTVCPLTPMHLIVDAQGYTRPTPGKPNANVCLHANISRFYQLLQTHLTPAPKP